MQKSIKKVRRIVDGILLLDKPIGISSNKALQKVKYLYNAKKAGHTGSLDPLASGMLPICLGRFTKIAGNLLNADKTYRVTFKLGAETNTGDLEGEIINQTEVTQQHLDKVPETLEKFTGEIQQYPPMYSAIKHNGQPLYKLARKGIEVERKPRNVNIYYIKNNNLNSENSFSIDIKCSKGTYIRTLIADIGRDLGCYAVVTELRRLSIEGFENFPMVSLDDLEEHSNNYEELSNFILKP